MKKYIFALIAVATISLASCRGNASTEATETAADSTSISIDSTGTTVDTTGVKTDTLK